LLIAWFSASISAKIAARRAGSGSAAQLLVELADLVEVRLLGGEVEGAELVGALEQHVLEVVGEAGRGRRGRCGCRCARRSTRDARLLPVGADVDGEAVLEPVDRDPHAVAGQRRVERRRQVGGGEDVAGRVGRRGRRRRGCGLAGAQAGE
jgi:hypothetical protein